MRFASSWVMRTLSTQPESGTRCQPPTLTAVRDPAENRPAGSMDGSRMSVLTADQRKILREQLLNQLSPLPNPRDWLHAAVGPQFVRGLNWNYEPPTLCEMV